MVDKQRGSKSFEDAMERTLDKGITVRPSDRLRVVSTGGTDRAQLVVTTTEESPKFPAIPRGRLRLPPVREAKRDAA